MKNNKYLKRTEDKSPSELRKMFPKDGIDNGIIENRRGGYEEEDENLTKQAGQALKNTTTRS